MKYWLFLISIHFPLIISYWSDQSTDYASLNTTRSDVTIPPSLPRIIIIKPAEIPMNNREYYIKTQRRSTFIYLPFPKLIFGVPEYFADGENAESKIGFYCEKKK